MTYLSKDDILKADDLPAEDVEVPEWGGIVRVRGLTGTERDGFEFRVAAAQKNGVMGDIDLRASLVARCLVDEDGKRMFTDKEVARLGAKSGAALDRIFDKVSDLSGMGVEAVKAAAEDFGGAPVDGSPSG